jgi:molybdopterin converting factor small subunit
MTAKLEFYGAIGDAMGRERMIELTDGSTISRVLTQLSRESQVFSAAAPGLRVALNDRIVERDAEVGNGDVIAFLPPFSGG